MSYSFGILYWINPTSKDLEFLIAKKYSKDLPLSLFYHEHEGFIFKLWSDTLGLLESVEDLNIKILEVMEPNLKQILSDGTLCYYIYVNYVPELIKSLNGFRNYLDYCGTPLVHKASGKT